MWVETDGRNVRRVVRRHAGTGATGALGATGAAATGALGATGATGAAGATGAWATVERCHGGWCNRRNRRRAHGRARHHRLIVAAPRERAARTPERRARVEAQSAVRCRRSTCDVREFRICRPRRTSAGASVSRGDDLMGQSAVRLVHRRRTGLNVRKRRVKLIEVIIERDRRRRLGRRLPLVVRAAGGLRSPVRLRCLRRRAATRVRNSPRRRRSSTTSSAAFCREALSRD